MSFLLSPFTEACLPGWNSGTGLFLDCFSSGKKPLHYNNDGETKILQFFEIFLTFFKNFF